MIQLHYDNYAKIKDSILAYYDQTGTHKTSIFDMLVVIRNVVIVVDISVIIIIVVFEVFHHQIRQ